MDWLAGSYSLMLLAQTGVAKTAISWVLVLLGLALGLAAVCSPSGRVRKLTDEEQDELEAKKKKKKKKK